MTNVNESVAHIERMSPAAKQTHLNIYVLLYWKSFYANIKKNNELATIHLKCDLYKNLSEDVSTKLKFRTRDLEAIHTKHSTLLSKYHACLSYNSLLSIHLGRKAHLDLNNDNTDLPDSFEAIFLEVNEVINRYKAEYLLVQ